MANEEQLKILNSGVEAWNKWRMKNPHAKIDLSEADLTGADLRRVDFREAGLQRAVLIGANLSGASLEKSDLRLAGLSKADLIRASLVKADLGGTNLIEANLTEALLYDADLTKADLAKANLMRAVFSGVRAFHANFMGANLRGADLRAANLNGAFLDGANLRRAIIALTIFGNTDLSKTDGLEETIHQYFSTIGTNTIRYSKGKIPVAFLRGGGLSDWEIESAKLYQPGLSAKEIDDILYRVHDLRVGQAVQINPLFISYSHRDSAFVDVMEKHLDEKGFRFWRDIHEATSGRLEKVVDQAMRQNPTVLLVLSENSVQSDWVEHEARSARELEKELKRDVLCPVALDGAWKDCPWPVRLREQIMEYNILDFSNWKDDAEFGRKFGKLVEGLDLFYKE